MSAVVVRTDGLTKRYPGGLVAVDDLGLEVREGDLYGFIGPNGAGKSTTIRMMLGLVFPTAGTVEVLGQAVPRHSASALLDVGALIEGPGFYPHLSGRRNLTLFDAAGKNGSHGTRKGRIDEVLERVGLADVGRRPVRAYSMGMRQRLGLAAALVRQPRLLILDEPTNGLDPQGIHELRTLFVDLVQEGTTVFLSSHLLAEVELICTRAAMMANGRLVAQDRVDALLAPTGLVRIESPDASEAAAFLRARNIPVEWLDKTHLRVHLNGEPAETINTMLVRHGLRIRELARERPTLEDVFLGLTGGAPADLSAEVPSAEVASAEVPSAGALPAPLSPPVDPATRVPEGRP